MCGGPAHAKKKWEPKYPRHFLLEHKAKSTPRCFTWNGGKGQESALSFIQFVAFIQVLKSRPCLEMIKPGEMKHVKSSYSNIKKRAFDHHGDTHS